MPEDQLSADPDDAADKAAADDDIIAPRIAPGWQPTAGEYRLTTE
ncbi:hypothetical protein [Streptomyces sp. NBC_00019]